jgi:hypothetical protein
MIVLLSSDDGPMGPKLVVHILYNKGSFNYYVILDVSYYLIIY